MQWMNYLNRLLIYSNNFQRARDISKQISFNVIPQIGPFAASGYTEEEEKMTNETKKILDKEIKVSAYLRKGPNFYRACRVNKC